jgi:hypothetical protein
MRKPIPIRSRIEARCAQLGLSPRDLNRRLGYANPGKARQRLELLCTGNILPPKSLRKVGQLIEHLPAALEVSREEIARWVEDQKAVLTAARHAEWARDVRPHAIIRTGEGGRPTGSITLCGMTSGFRARRVDFPPDQPAGDYVVTVQQALRERKELRQFFPAEGFVIHYSPTRFVEYDLAGGVREVRTEPYLLGAMRLKF